MWNLWVDDRNLLSVIALERQTRAGMDITIDIFFLWLFNVALVTETVISIDIAYIRDINQSVVFVCVKARIPKGDIWTELFKKSPTNGSLSVTRQYFI